MCNHNMPSLGTSSNDKRVHFDACWQHLGHSCKAACPQHIDHKRPILVETHENQPQSPSQGPQICLIETYRNLHLPSIIHSSTASLQYHCWLFGSGMLGSWWLHQHSPIWEVLHHQGPIFTMPGFQWLEMWWMYCLCFPRLKHGIWPDGEKTCCTANLDYNFWTGIATENASKDYIGRSLSLIFYWISKSSIDV